MTPSHSDTRIFRSKEDRTVSKLMVTSWPFLRATVIGYIMSLNTRSYRR